jgi:hypothetical protein
LYYFSWGDDQEVVEMSGTKQFFNGLKEGMKNFRYNLATLINSILLLIVYFIGVGVTSIVAKLFGKHFLETKISREKESYWSDPNLTGKSTETCYRQF